MAATDSLAQRYGGNTYTQLSLKLFCVDGDNDDILQWRWRLRCRCRQTSRWRRASTVTMPGLTRFAIALERFSLSGERSTVGWRSAAASKPTSVTSDATSTCWMFCTAAVLGGAGARWMSWSQPSETDDRATSSLTTTSKSTTSACRVSLSVWLLLLLTLVLIMMLIRWQRW